MMTPIDLHRFDTPEAVADAAAAHIVHAAQNAIAERGRFIWALSGGDTPRQTYERVARPDLRDQIQWRDTLVLWTDERCVPPEHEGSNYRMACEALLDRVPLPADNVLRIRGEACSLTEDQRYERALHRLLGPPPAGGRIDLTLLGVGADGHTASLFPHSTALAERQRWVLPAIGPEPYPQRITLTLPLFNASRTVIVLAVGDRKAHIIRRLVRGEADPSWPVLGVQPHDGGPVWLVDQQAFPDV